MIIRIEKYLSFMSLRKQKNQIKYLKLSSLLVGVFVLGFAFTARAAMFNRNLTQGSSGTDVKLLQKYLNEHNFPLAQNGPGSAGNETSYFGPLLKSALIKFQEFYADQILTPSGLVHGTGNFFAVTRGFVNFSLATTSTPTPVTITTPLPPVHLPTTTKAGFSYQGSYASGGGGSNPVQQSGGSQPVAPVITFNSITKNFGDANFTLTPISNGAGSFNFSSSNTNVATAFGNTATIVGVGTTTLTAFQAALGAYSSGSATATLTVNPIVPTITLADIATTTVNPFHIIASSPSSGSLTYSSSNTAVATISGNTITPTGYGTTTITTIQAPSGNYSTGTKTSVLALNVVDVCSIVAPCENGGACTNVFPEDYSCSCTSPYSGSMCELSDSYCNINYGAYRCLNLGQCVATQGGGQCSCQVGWIGPFCDIPDLSEASYRLGSSTSCPVPATWWPRNFSNQARSY